MPPTIVFGDANTYTVTGTVFSPALPGIGGLEVQLVDKNVGGDQVLGSTRTGRRGAYAFAPFTIGHAYLEEHYKQRPDLQVHVSGTTGVLASSAVTYSAPSSVTLDVTLPDSATGLPSEYEILTANLAAAYPGSLGALQESDGRQDITYLANKTGWDARAVALAALADQFSQLTARVPVLPPEPEKTQELPVPVVSLRPEYYYALFRAGLPASADALFRASSAGVQGVWEQATRQGIIPSALADEIPGAVRAFQALSAARLLTTAPPAGYSTLEEMLRPVLPEAAQREGFARLYAERQGDWSDFWTEVDRQAGTSAAEQLQLLGQLYCLTLNNEPLVTALLAAETEPPLRSTADLASRGYYDATSWAPLIGTAIPLGTRCHRRRAGSQLRGAAGRPGPALLPDRDHGQPDTDRGHPGNREHRHSRAGGQLPDREPGHVRDRGRAGRGVPGAHRRGRPAGRRDRPGQPAAAGLPADPRRREHDRAAAPQP